MLGAVHKQESSEASFLWKAIMLLLSLQCSDTAGVNLSHFIFPHMLQREQLNGKEPLASSACLPNHPLLLVPARVVAAAPSALLQKLIEEGMTLSSFHSRKEVSCQKSFLLSYPLELELLHLLQWKQKQCCWGGGDGKGGSCQLAKWKMQHPNRNIVYGHFLSWY